MVLTLSKDEASPDDILDEPAEGDSPDEGVALRVQDLLVPLKRVDEDGIRVGEPEVPDQGYLGHFPHPCAEGLLGMARGELVDRLTE